MIGACRNPRNVEIEVWRMGLFCKIVGAVCVMGASGYLATSMNQALESRKRELRKLYSLLLQLKSEMQYMCTPLPEIFRKLADLAGDPFRSWLSQIAQQLEEKEAVTFFNVWLEALANLHHNSSLEREDIEPLSELADKLGTGDVSAQLKAIDYTLLHIERNRTTLEEEMVQKKKVTVTLSLFCGAMTLLLLL